MFWIPPRNTLLLKRSAGRKPLGNLQFWSCPVSFALAKSYTSIYFPTIRSIRFREILFPLFCIAALLITVSKYHFTCIKFWLCASKYFIYDAIFEPKYGVEGVEDSE
jgi:hypothetical protein